MTALQGHDLSSLRRQNGRAVLAALWSQDDAQTVRQLASVTKLSRPTIEAALSDLSTQGLVSTESPKSRGSGRPSRAYSLKASGGVVIGIDAGPHGISGTIGDLRGDPLASHSSPAADLSGCEDALSAIHHEIDYLLASTPHARHEVRALTIALPGIVDPTGNLAVSTVVPDWVTGGLLERISAAYPGAHVSIDNDAKLAALAELDQGSIALGETAIVLQAGHRISAAIVVEGRVARGAHGAAGEIGALSSLGWSTAYERLKSDGDPATSLLFAASEGNPRALDIVDQFADNIAEGLSALSLSIDPHRTIIGGGISNVGEPLAEALRTRIAARAIFPPELVLSSLGAHAPQRGALTRAAEHVRESLLSR
ncbi:ROK family transcriptional regulator [Zhihengliuella halotolerans]|uniref:Putative NBD/HSP70 family sugar kinase n=1 Tax=Zhihengliuella halotolerans TaxID=370736 RepID=A0A4Q8AFH7_9MICC|nr:ROK family transcriptional regulator [Zhihengliuella halotolerans]RZU63070.1 putative NBD/HSP70 family sugar kinase [Zhihengliuella halotolerans]